MKKHSENEDKPESVEITGFCDIIKVSKERRYHKMQIEYSKKAAKYINALDRPTKQRIKAAIEGLTEEPPKGDIKTMQGFTDGRKRLRVGKYRIIYNYL